jgi:hypothetical protein
LRVKAILLVTQFSGQPIFIVTSKNNSSIFQETLALQHLQDSPRQFTLEIGLFIAILFGSFMLMVNDLSYNTLFLDEAINAVIGKEFLLGDYSRNAMTFHFGSYLYPALSTIMNKIGGITAMRLTSTGMMCLAAIFVYLTARNIFGYKAGLISLLLFSFSGNILDLGQLAVYDSLALPFLAASLFLLVSASTSEYHQRRLLLVSSACAILATLSKYIGLIYLPALFMTALILFWLKGTPLQRALSVLFFNFVLPVLFVLSLYSAYYWHELIQVFQEQGYSLAHRWLILIIIGQNIGFVLLLALAGFVLIIIATKQNQSHDSLLLFWSEGSRNERQSFPRIFRIILPILLLLLFCTWLAAPLEQWLTANGRSLWKNCAYSLIFLTPIAGYCLTTTIDYIRSRKLVINLIGLLFFCVSVIYFANNALDANWSFHGSWPNVDGALTYLRNAGLDENSSILAEGMDIYEYYLTSGKDNTKAWNNFSSMDYDAILAALHNHAFDFIIIDDYYSPGIRERMNPVLAESGYAVSWQEAQKLRSGDTILLQVFIPNGSDLK